MANLTDFTDPIIQYQLEHINDSRIPSIRIAAAFCLSAAYIAVFLRVLSRQLGNIKLGSDDWCIILALVCRYAEEAVPLADRTNSLSRQHSLPLY